MSTALPFAGVGAVTTSATESEAFGFGVARLSIGGEWSRDVADHGSLVARVSAALDAEPADTVIVRFPSELVELTRLDTGRRLRHAGTLLYWEDPLPADTGVEAPAGSWMSPPGSRPNDDFVRTAVSVIRDSFDGYLNHYSYNRRIPAAVARDGYIDWTRSTIADAEGAGIVLLEGATPVAAATVRLHLDGPQPIAEVELAGVSTALQGGGRYGTLWQAIRSAARDAGAERLVISTQASNLRVQRAWARLGLLPLASFDTVHAER